MLKEIAESGIEVLNEIESLLILSDGSLGWNRSFRLKRDLPIGDESNFGLREQLLNRWVDELESLANRLPNERNEQTSLLKAIQKTKGLVLGIYLRVAVASVRLGDTSVAWRRETGLELSDAITDLHLLLNQLVREPTGQDRRRPRSTKRKRNPRMPLQKVAEHWKEVFASENRNLIQFYLTAGEVELAKQIGTSRNTLRKLEAFQQRAAALLKFNRENR